MLIPYAAAIAGGARLIYSVLKTEREFQAADRTTRNRIQVVQTLTLMSQDGHHHCPSHGRRAWQARAWEALCREVGNFVGGIGGAVAGALYGRCTSTSTCEPHMLDLALDITGPHPRRPLLLQEQAACRCRSPHLPDQGPGVGRRARLEPAPLPLHPRPVHVLRRHHDGHAPVIAHRFDRTPPSSGAPPRPPSGRRPGTLAGAPPRPSSPPLALLTSDPSPSPPPSLTLAPCPPARARPRHTSRSTQRR